MSDQARTFQAGYGGDCAFCGSSGTVTDCLRCEKAYCPSCHATGKHNCKMAWPMKGGSIELESEQMRYRFNVTDEGRAEPTGVYPKHEGEQAIKQYYEDKELANYERERRRNVGAPTRSEYNECWDLIQSGVDEEKALEATLKKHHDLDERDLRRAITRRKKRQ